MKQSVMCRIRSSYVFYGFILIAMIVMTTSVMVGNYPLSFHKIMNIVFHLSDETVTEIDRQVVLNIRLPRILLAFTAGAILGLSGAVLQGVFYNPLVDPHVIGVTSGAAFGGTLAILLGLGIKGLILSSFGFGVLALAIILFLSSLFKQQKLLILVLIGVLLNGFFSALVSLLQYLADTEEKLPNIVFWLMGSFATANWNKVLIFIIPALIVSIILIRLSWRINILSLSEEEARALGVNVKWIRSSILVLCAIIVSLQVSVSGSIGWVGLIIPYFARILVGANHQRLLPFSLVIGGIYMVIVDDIARLISSSEVPISIITALVGAPCFLMLLYRQMKHKRF